MFKKLNWDHFISSDRSYPHYSDYNEIAVQWETKKIKRVPNCTDTKKKCEGQDLFVQEVKQEYV